MAPLRRKVPSRLKPWSCTACTFENAGNHGACKMCDKKREAESRDSLSCLDSYKPIQQAAKRLPKGMRTSCSSAEKRESRCACKNSTTTPKMKTVSYD